MQKEFKEDFIKAMKAVTIGIPMLWLLPFITETMQHFVEYQLGMFTKGDGIEAGQETFIRLIFGVVKVISVVITTILVIKLGVNAWPRGKYFSYIKKEPYSLALISASMLILIFVVHYWGQNITDFVLKYITLPESIRPYTPILIILTLTMLFRAQMIRFYLKTVHIEVNEDRFKKDSYLFELYQVAFLVILVLPLMLLHIHLNNYAVGQPDILLWSILLLDSLVVGALAIGIGLSLYLALYLVFNIRENKSAPI